MRRVKPSKRLVPRGAVWFLAGVSDEVIIRAAAREDVPGILLIYNAAVREPAAAYEDVPHTLAQREEWFDHFTGRNYPILVAETAGVIVGWGSLGPHQERMGFRFTGAVAVYVTERSRRQGARGNCTWCWRRLMRRMSQVCNCTRDMASRRQECFRRPVASLVNGVM